MIDKQIGWNDLTPALKFGITGGILILGYFIIAFIVGLIFGIMGA